MSTNVAVQGCEKTCPMYRTASIGLTDYWNDSCASEELAYAIRNGAVGATTNPSIVLNVLKKEHAAWKEKLSRMSAEHSPADSPVDWRR